MSNPVETFWATYREELDRAIREHPEEYIWPKGINGVTVESVVAKMRAAQERGTFSKDGRAFRATCKRLGIKHTYTAINALLGKSK